MEQHKLDTVEDVMAFLKAHFGKSHQGPLPEIGPDTQLLQTGLLDSFELIELAADIANTVGARVSGSDFVLEDFETPQMLFNRLNELRS